MSAFGRLFSVSILSVLIIGSLLAGGVSLVQAAERQLVVIEGADYFGLDYETLKEVDLEGCKSACIADGRCKAFTYNTKARWCFLKSNYGDVRAFEGAVSGYIGEDDVAKPELRAVRLAELAFLRRSYLEEARGLGDRITNRVGSVSRSFDALLEDARAARYSGNPQRAMDLYAALLKIAPENPARWLEMAETLSEAKPKGWKLQRQFREDATAAAVNSYLRSRTEGERARALAVLGRALASRSAWKPAILATRASLALADASSLRAAYDKLMAEHGFRVIEHRVDSDALNPRICVRFSDPLPTARPHLTDFVKVEGGTNLALEPEQQQICVDGVQHGQRYRILLRAGLPAADGEKLPKNLDLDIYVRDRRSMVRFLGRAYVLPRGGEATIPIVSVNTGSIKAEVHRVGDRAMARSIGDGPFLRQLNQYEVNQLGEKTGEKVWAGTLEVGMELNRDVTTAVPVGAMIEDFKPGAYVMTAWPRDAGKDSEALATQWFVVSDIGLAGFSGNDGLHAVVRSLSTAGPMGEVSLRLVALNDEVLGRTATDASGYARFEPGLLRGTGGNAPALLVAEGPEGDYGLLDLTRTPFDLTDRGVDGRPAPKPLDVYLVSERGIYRAGETVQLTALVRGVKADAVTDLPLTIVVKRPDGVEHSRLVTDDQGLGGRQVAVELPPSAMRGTWRAEVFSDPKGKALAQLSFLVEDFEPERLTFDLASPVRRIDPGDPPSITVDARFLYGAPASNLALEGTVSLKASDRLAGFSGYRFGLASEESEPVSRPIASAKTDGDGRASIPLELPKMVPLSRPQMAEVSVSLLDTGGRPVERSIDLPVADRRARVGIKPLFEGSVDEGGTAAFEVIAVGPEGGRTAREGLGWTLSKVTTTFQWYQIDGKWSYESVSSSERVASGTVDASEADFGRIEARVDWGGYVLQVQTADGTMLPASVEFEAGWYQAPGSFDTPDLLKVSLDKPSYRVGETARARIEPRFPGLAMVMVLDDRLISMKAVRVPVEGTTADLPVTDDWGPGAYVTAVLFRPMDIAAKRMPRRAIGLTWVSVDPGDRRLDLGLQVAEKVKPRQPLDIAVALGNLAAGEEAYVTVAAVDLGILNLTRYESPAPDNWYFGQRRLGMEMRDLYGQLIDRMQGVPGVVRSGGDAPLMRFEGPPPTETLVAFHSGILRLDAEGRASLSFDLPDFNGTVRVMAMAWSRTGVGHAVRDLVVRDPVVITASLPRFLAPGDRSRVLIELAHVEGPSGDVGLRVETSGAKVAVDVEAAVRTLSLAERARAQVLVPVEALAVGDDTLTITTATPGGEELVKTLTIPVRLNEPPVVRTSVFALTPGTGRLEVARDMLSDVAPGTGRLLVSVSGAGRLDVPGLVRQLDRFPFGCAEQLTSRALPLLYLDGVALAAGLEGGEETGSRVREAISGVLAKQSSNGGFGLWGADGGDLWLDAYITDFLTRARERGHEVPVVAFDMAVDNLRNRLAYAPDFQSGGEDVAYTLYVLARNGRASIGDLRYYAETKLDAFATPLARGQIGAALALYGDRPRGDAAFRSASAMLKENKDTGGWRPDYGSALRDGAALLTLAAETGTTAVEVPMLARRVGGEFERASYTSTQEKAWVLLAANALNQGAAQPRLTVDGDALDGALFRSFDAAQIEAGPLSIENRGDRAVDALVTVTGVPLSPEPAGGSGYEIERAYYDLEGRRVEPTGIGQGERMVVVLTVRSTGQRAARLILNDPLPAGFEIDNPNLVNAGDVAAIPWLGLVDYPAHKEFRADRFVAAIDRGARDRSQFQIAYLVRAVSPGVFVHPAATVEDMYRPTRRARTAPGAVEVVGPLR